MTQDHEAIPEARPYRRPELLLYAGVGIAAAVLGLLPWFLRAAYPSPTIASVQAADAELVLLPFTRYSAPLLPSLVIVGYSLAGLLARRLRPHRPRRAGTALVMSTSATFLLAAVQTLLVVAGLDDLRDVIGAGARIDRPLHVRTFTAVAVGAILLGVVVFRLLTSLSRAAAAVGATVTGLALAQWFSALVLPLVSSPNEVATAQEVRWLQALIVVTGFGPAVVAGAAIAWAGFRTPGWFPGVIGSLALLWFVPAALQAVTLHLALGAGTLSSLPALLLDSLLTSQRAFAVVVAVAVAGAGIGLRALRTRSAARKAPRTAPNSPA